MKCSDKAHTYIRRLPKGLVEGIPDTVMLVHGLDPHPDHEPEKCIAVVDNLASKEIVGLAKSSGFNHIVQSSPETFATEVAISANMISRPGSFFSNPVPVILRSEDGPQEAKKWAFKALDSKDEIKDGVSDYIHEISEGRFLLEPALAVADELFTNAFYHGLNKKEGKLLPEIFICHDGKYLLIGCIDSLGRLTREKLTKYLWATYLGDKIQSLNTGDGGAGIGCRMVFNHCVGFYAAVKPNAKTVVCATLPMSRKHKFNLEWSKNIHLLM